MDLLPCPYQSLDANGCFLAVNEAWLRLLGYRAEDVIGKSFADFMTGHYAVLFPQRFREFRKTGEVNGVRFDLRTARGTAVPCRFDGRIEYDADGEMLRTHCILHEADEQVRLADSLRRSENKLHAVLATAQEAILILDPQQRITRANPAAGELLGAKAADLAGHAFLEFVAEDSQEPARHLLARADEMDEAHAGRNLSLHHRDGHLLTTRTKAKNVRDEPRSLLATVLALADVGQLVRTEEELHASHDLNLALLDNTGDGILVFGSDSRLAWANRRAADLYGLALNSMLGLPPGDFMPEEEWARFRAVPAAGDGGGEPAVRHVRERADGPPLPLELHGCAVMLGGRPHTLFTLRDLSAAERALASLRECENLHQQVQQSITDGVAIYEAVDNGADFRIRDLNPAACRYSGKSREEFIGHCLSEVFPGPGLEAFREVLRAAWRSGEPQDMPLRPYELRGRTLWFENRFLPLPSGDILAIFRDRTAQRETAANLRAGESHLQGLVENLPALVAAFDADGVPLVWNQECERITGYSAAEVVGNPQAFAWMYPDPEVRRRRMELQSPGSAGFRNLEWTMRGKDGSYRTLLISNLANEFPVPGWASWAIGLDITAYREIERQTSARREELEERVRERTEELRAMVTAMAGRELRMAELKAAVATLRGQLREAGLAPAANDPLAEEEDSP
jgi:PAS domain S-box-containing protein